MHRTVSNDFLKCIKLCGDNEEASSGGHRRLGFEQWSLIIHRRKLTGTAAHMSEVV